MAWGRLALLQAGDDEQLCHKLAEVFGYLHLPDEEQGKKQAAAEVLGPSQTSNSAEETIAETQRLPACFPRINKLIRHQSAADHSQQPRYLTDPAMRFQDEDAPRGSYRFAPPPALLPMARLLPFLFNSLASSSNGAGLDARLLIRRIEQGKALQGLPKRQRLRWPQRLQIIVDTAQRLQPHWADFERIVQHMQSMLGKEALQALRFDERTLGEETCSYLPWPNPKQQAWQDWQLPAADVAVLILSDLGVNDPRVAVSWQRQLAGLVHHPGPVVTLSPASYSPEQQSCSYSLTINPLNDGQQLSRYPLPHGFSMPQPTEQVIEDVLTWLSPLPLVDSGLLRRLRIGLDWGNSTLETRIWNHPKMRDIGIGIQLQPKLAQQYQQQYQQRYAGTARAQCFWTIIQEHHAGAFKGLQQLERFKQCATEGIIDAAMSWYYQRLCATSMQSANDPSLAPAQQRALQLQCRTVLAALSNSIWNSQFSDLAYDLYAVAYRDEIRAGYWPDQLDSEFKPERLVWLLDKQVAQQQQWHIVQVDDQGRVSCTRHSDTNTVITPLVEFSALQWLPPRVSQSSLDAGQVTPIPSAGTSFQLLEQTSTRVETQAITLELDAIKKPSWASAIWRNAKGLCCSIPWLNQELEVWWKTSDSEANGRWLWPAPFAEDDDGLYVDLSVKAVTQRLRWIEPGRFWMGSPADEAEREWAGMDGYQGTETLHQVGLSRGYWLGDSTVTQAFWQALMGHNPSHFKNRPQHPVEQVSWQDAQRFLDKLNALFPGLLAQLPSEAQWEYACRAGTTTSFSFGANISPEQVNYNGRFPYAHGKKGQNRKQTVTVKLLPANPWGLYEMHGNVWEWCADAWQQQMPADLQIDPLNTVAADDDVPRVVRGGSWNSDGRGTRSAIRNRNGPVRRNNSLGFRLALGHAR